MENTSGQGKQAAIPAELKGWNWGAFLMNWIWGIFNKTYIALLTLVPFVGVFIPFVLGFKGNAWAWRNKKWENIDHFRMVQKKWAMWGVIIFVFSLVLSAGSVFFLFETLKSSEPYVMAIDKVQLSREAQNIIGAPIKPGWWMTGEFSTEGTDGKADFSIPVEGSKQKGVVHVMATKQLNKWKIEQLSFLPESGGATINLLKIPQLPPKSPGQAKQMSPATPGQTRQPPPPAIPPAPTSPPEKESMQRGKVNVAPGAAAVKPAKKDTVAERLTTPAAAPVVAVTVPQPVKPAVTKSSSILGKKQSVSKPKKKYAKKPVPERQSPYDKAMAKKKTPTDFGRARITAGDYQGAIKTLSTAIAKYPEDSINYRLRGNAYDNLGKREQAIADWKKAATLGDTIIQSYLDFLEIDGE